METTRARWAAVGAVLAVSLGAGGMGVANAVVDEGPKPIFVPITPCRIMDTRTAGDFNTGPRATPLGPNETYVVSATDPARNGDCGTVIPPEAVGLVLNVTITDPTRNTFVTVFPTGVALPDASNLNALAGKLEPTPNLVTTDLSANGQFSVYNLNGTTNVLADVAGYYEDHNHDDRYLTDAEVAALIAAERAAINADLDARDDRLRGEFAAGDDQLRDDIVRIDGELVRIDGDIVRIDDEIVRIDDEIVRIDDEIVRIDGDIVRIDDELVRIDGDIVRIDDELVRIDGDIVRIDGELVRIDGELVRIESLIVVLP